MTSNSTNNKETVVTLPCPTSVDDVLEQVSRTAANVPQLDLHNRSMTDSHCFYLQELFLKLHIFATARSFTQDLDRKVSFNKSAIIVAGNKLKEKDKSVEQKELLGEGACEDVSVSVAMNKLVEGQVFLLGTLDLSTNKISSAGLRLFLHAAATALAPALQPLELLLASNELDKSTGKLLYRILTSKQCRIETLILNNNSKLGDEAIAYIAKALTVQGSWESNDVVCVRKLGLGNVGMSAIGASLLLNALYTNTHVQILDVDRNAIENTMVADLQHMVEKNRGDWLSFTHGSTIPAAQMITDYGALSYNVHDEKSWLVEKAMLEMLVKTYERQKQALVQSKAKLTDIVNSYKERREGALNFVFKDVKKAVDNAAQPVEQIELVEESATSNDSNLLVEETGTKKPEQAVVPPKPQAPTPSAVNDEYKAKGANCVASFQGKSGESTLVGQTYKFVVKAANSKGKGLVFGGEDITVKLDEDHHQHGKISIAPTSWYVKVDDLCDGSYIVEFTPDSSGVFQFSILIDDEHVSGSPFKIGVAHEPTALLSSFTGLSPSLTYRVGDPIDFTLVAKDSFGEEFKQTPQYSFDVKVKRLGAFQQPTQILKSQVYPLDLKDNNNGKYSTKFAPEASGFYIVEATYKNDHIMGSPIMFAVHSKTFGPLCRASGLGIKKYRSFLTLAMSAKQEESAETHGEEFTIQACDTNGDEVHVGGDQFQVRIVHKTSNKEAPVRVNDLNNGKYQVKYELKSAGNYACHITCELANNKAVPIYGSPFELCRSQYKIDGQMSTLEDIGIFYRGIDNRFAVVPRDASGNPVLFDERADFKVVITNPTSKSAVFSTKASAELEIETGKHWLSMKPMTLGDYKVEVSFKGKEVTGSPAIIKVLDSTLAPCLPNTVVRGPGIQMMQQPDHTTISDKVAYSDICDTAPALYVNETAKFMVLLRNFSNQPLQHGDDHVRAAVTHAYTGDNMPSNVTDLKNGNYLVEYVPLLPGRYNIAVFVNREPVRQRAFHAFVSANSKPESCTIATSVSFTIQVFNSFTNAPMQQTHFDPQSNQVQVAISGPAKTTNTSTYIGNGKYQIQVQGKEKGTYKADVTLNGKAIASGPIEFKL